MRRTLTVFLALAFGISWPLFLVPIAFGSPGSPERQTATLVAWSVAMWGPGLAAILATRLAARESLGSLRLRHLGPRRPYLWAWLVPPILAVATGFVTMLMGAGTLDLSFPALRAWQAQTPGAENTSLALVVAIQVAVALTVGPLFNVLFAMGEELGWRGFLLPRLLPLGRWRAILLSGAIWGVWHAPAIAQGHNYPGQPVLGILLMVVFCVLEGTVFSWLYLRTRSPWAPALAHGSLNASAGLPLLFLTGVNDITIGGTATSLAGLAVLAVFVAWLAWRVFPTLPEQPVKDASLSADGPH